MKDKEIKKSKTVKIEKSPKGRKTSEISPEAKEERRLLTAFLLDKTEELIRERNRRKKQVEEEKIELGNGKFFSRSEIKQFVTALKRVYSAIFPNENPFFKNMFRLHPKLFGFDPNNYNKPYLAGKLLKLLTYSRFNAEYSIEVLPALIVLAMPDGMRLHKCHEYLTDAGIKEMIRFRDEANEMMAKFEDLKWYDFLKEYCAKNKIVFQPKFF